jgi:general secretion pathway protein K
MTDANRPGCARDSGAALLSVLMVVAAMSVVVVVAVEAISRATRLAEVTGNRTESFWFARSAEAAGGAYVTTLIELSEARLTDATPRIGVPVTQPVEGGVLVATLSDATNCFNLNALAEPSDEGWGIDPDQLRRLEKLVETMGFGPYDSGQMAHSVADWIDSDTVSRPNGAEDGYYAGLDPSYRTPGTPLQSVRELRAIGPFDPETFAFLRTVLCVRPETAQATLNLNTLQAQQAGLLTSLFSSELDVETARRLIEARPLGGWGSVDEFLALEELGQIADHARNVSSIDVVSSHVLIDGTVTLSGHSSRFELLYGFEADNTAALLRRRYGEE